MKLARMEKKILRLPRLSMELTIYYFIIRYACFYPRSPLEHDKNESIYHVPQLSSVRLVVQIHDEIFLCVKGF